MNIYPYNQELQLASCCTVGIISSQAKKKAWKKYWTSSGPEIMLYLVHRVTVSIKPWAVKLEQAVSESLPHKSLVWIPFHLRSACAMRKE